MLVAGSINAPHSLAVQVTMPKIHVNPRNPLMKWHLIQFQRDPFTYSQFIVKTL